MATIPQPRFDRVVGVERKRRLRREEFIMLLVKGRVYIQLGGKAGGRSGWTARTVTDSPDEARKALQTMLDTYLDENYRQTTSDESVVPVLPDEMWDADFDGDAAGQDV